MTVSADWTVGVPALAHDECRSCAHRWSLPRTACPVCGTTLPRRVRCSGRGRLAAVSVVHPTSETPYTLVLVDLDEGVRVMGRGEPGVTVGAPVRVELRDGLPWWAPQQ